MNHFFSHMPKTGGTAIAVYLSKTNRFFRYSGAKSSAEIHEIITENKIEDPIFMAHQLFGMDRNLLQGKYYIVLRNPIEVSISVWAAYCNQSHMNYHKLAINNTISNFQVEYLNNPICRSLLGTNGRYYMKQLVSSDIDKCLKILSTYTIVGDYDEYDDFVTNFKKETNTSFELKKSKFTLGEYLPIQKNEYFRLKDVGKYDCAIYEIWFNKKVKHEYFKD